MVLPSFIPSSLRMKAPCCHLVCGLSPYLWLPYPADVCSFVECSSLTHLTDAGGVGAQSTSSFTSLLPQHLRRIPRGPSRLAFCSELLTGVLFQAIHSASHPLTFLLSLKPLLASQNLPLLLSAPSLDLCPPAILTFGCPRQSMLSQVTRYYYIGPFKSLLIM